MVWLIIAGLVIFIIYKFLSDRNKLLDKIAREGGLKYKFRVLIEGLMEGPNARIEEVLRDSVVITWRSPSQLHQFQIIPAFNKFEVIWKAQLANHILENKWMFNDHDDQEIALNMIMQYIDTVSQRTLLG